MIGYLIIMKIRNADIKDSKSIVENNLKLAKESENRIISYRTVLDGVRRVLSDGQKGFYLVAEENNEIIGQMMITYEWSDW